MGKITNGRSLASGVAFSAPLGTDLPTTVADAISNLDSAFKNLGELNADGIKFIIDKQTISLENMNGEDVFDIITSHKVRIEITPMEFLNADACKEWAGASNVTIAEDGDMTELRIMQSDVEQRSYVFVVALTDNRAAVITVPVASMTKDTIELTMKGNDGIMPSLEFTAYGNEDGLKARILFAKR